LRKDIGIREKERLALIRTTPYVTGSSDGTNRDEKKKKKKKRLRMHSIPILSRERGEKAQGKHSAEGGKKRKKKNKTRRRPAASKSLTRPTKAKNASRSIRRREGGDRRLYDPRVGGIAN